MDLLSLIEARQVENLAQRERLTRESTLLREAATRLRTGERERLVLAVLWASGINPREWPGGHAVAGGSRSRTGQGGRS